MNSKLYDIHQYDARKIDRLIKDPIVDVTVTSPPYFDMKDYGCKEQIGFGQSYQEYLNDIGIVFKSIYACTKPTGSL
jgi:DNA modification methylase